MINKHLTAGIVIGVVLFLFGVELQQAQDSQTRMEQKYISLLQVKQQELELVEVELATLKYKAFPVEKLFSFPLKGDEFSQITSAFGARIDPFKENTGGDTNTNDGNTTAHVGVDLSGVWRAEVFPIAPGVVIDKWWPPGGQWKGHEVYGCFVRVRHPNGFVSEYAHLSEAFVHEGDYIIPSAPLGRMGSTGRSTGQHLHLALLDNDGVYVNPLVYMKEL